MGRVVQPTGWIAFGLLESRARRAACSSFTPTSELRSHRRLGPRSPRRAKKAQPATIARAKFVEKVLSELRTIHPRMHNESCFEQLAANHSEFSILKIARTDSDVKRSIEYIQERCDLVKLAQEIAARHFKKSNYTLATDWSRRKKPRKKAMK